ncbi:MAG: VOC family protein [Alphaproteobacteria bacterium]|nr:VOC family protein [Alphaproteobacteria bacterium]
MAATANKFVWYDLMTTDIQAAEIFYAKVIGWEAKDSGMPGHPYTLFSADTVMVAGLMPMPPEVVARGARPGWNGYIGVDDVDACAARVKASGGSVHHEPQDIPQVGRYAVVGDPQGAVFMLFSPAGNPPAPPEVAPGSPGHVGWHELQAGDQQSAFAFYADLFGWTKAEAVDMGPIGVYQIFATGGPPVGGMMNKLPQIPAPFWLYYFNVDNIDAAVARVGGEAGQVVNGPQQVPGGSWIAQCRDPQGAMFAMVGPRG